MDKRENWSNSGQEYNRAAQKAYSARISDDMRKRVAEIFASANDVKSFKVMFNKMRKDIIANTPKEYHTPLKMVLDESFKKCLADFERRSLTCTSPIRFTGMTRFEKCSPPEIVQSVKQTLWRPLWEAPKDGTWIIGFRDRSKEYVVMRWWDGTFPSDMVEYLPDEVLNDNSGLWIGADGAEITGITEYLSFNPHPNAPKTNSSYEGN